MTRKVLAKQSSESAEQDERVDKHIVRRNKRSSDSAVRNADGWPEFVGQRYQLIQRLGSGTFGDVFLAVDCLYNIQVALKLERVDAPYPQLHSEAAIYSLLRNETGFPRMRQLLHDGNCTALVMDALGPSLEAVFVYNHRRLSPSTVALLAEQMLRRLAVLHTKGFIHRDIKPDNFVYGIGPRRAVVYLIDFGLAKSYINPTTGQHIDFRTDRQLTGTARYSSVNVHCHYEQSRRDDLEALAHVLIYFLTGGRLPWQGLNAPSPLAKYDLIGRVKMNTSVAELCCGLPAEFASFLIYCRSLRFDEDPDYDYLSELLQNVIKRFPVKAV